MEQKPLEIRPHLIPFLFEELEGNEAAHDNVNAKFIPFQNKSSMARYLHCQMGYKSSDNKPKFLFYLVICQKNKLHFSGSVYIETKGLKEKLFIDAEKVTEFNNLIEDVFRVSFKSFVDGCLFAGLSLKNAIEYFLDKYDLYEFGYDFENFRMIYYRQKNKRLLNRIQIQSSNQVKAYK